MSVTGSLEGFSLAPRLQRGDREVFRYFINRLSVTRRARSLKTVQESWIVHGLKPRWFMTTLRASSPFYSEVRIREGKHDRFNSERHSL